MSVKSLQTYILEIYPILLGKSFIINGKHLLPAIFKSLHRDQMRSEAELWLGYPWTFVLVSLQCCLGSLVHCYAEI